MSNEIDTLMDLDPLELTAKNVDQIVAYHRQRRAELEANPGKRSKPKKETGGVEINVEELLSRIAPTPAVVIKRRI